jgi:hypothetical protein
MCSQSCTSKLKDYPVPLGDDDVPDWNLLNQVQNAKLREQQSSGTGSDVVKPTRKRRKQDKGKLSCLFLNFFLIYSLPLFIYFFISI